ncbi:signal peptidase I [Candidatus Dependentiae bacterium]
MNNVKTKKTSFLSNLKEIMILLLVVFSVRTFGFGLYQLPPSGSMATTMLDGERYVADKFTILFTKINHGDIVSMNSPTFKFSSNPVVHAFQKYVWGPDNWTKRVIGEPGDTVKGVIENGKPHVYVNGKKLNENYVNKYPLIRVWRKDPAELKALIQQNPNINLGQFLGLKTYDPSKPFDQQPFHQIKEERIFVNPVPGEPTTGRPVLLYPGTPISDGGERRIVSGKNYWGSGDEFHVKLGKDQYWVMGDNRLGSSDSRVFGPIDGDRIHGRIVFRLLSVDSDEMWQIWDFIKNPVSFFKRIRWNRLFQSVS